MQARHGGLAVIGVPVDNLGLNEVVDRIEAYIAAGGFHQVATVNVNFLVNSVRSRELHRVLGGCDLVVPDGMPLLWFSRWMNLPLPERVAGIDLIPHLARLSALRGYRIFFLGSSEESSIAAAENLRMRFPGVQIEGFCPPWRPIDDLDNDTILARIEEASPDILLVAFGNPKQEIWLARLRHQLRVPVCIGIGGSFDLLAGAIKRSPEKYQRWGLEWLYRIAQEPRRLLGRYVADFSQLLFPLGNQMLFLALQGSRRSLEAVEVQHMEGAEVVHLRGGLTAADRDAVQPYADGAIQAGKYLVLDMAGIHYVGPDATQWLIRLGFALKEAGSTLWITAPRRGVMRVLCASRIDEVICIDRDRDDTLERIALAGLPYNYDGVDGLAPLHSESMLQRADG